MSRNRASSVVAVRAGGRRYLVGPRLAFPLRPGGGAHLPFATLDLIAREGAAVAQLRGRLGDCHPGRQDADPAPWLRRAVAQGAVAVVPVAEGAPAAPRPFTPPRLAVPDLRPGLTQPPAGPAALAGLSPVGRVTEMMLRSLRFLPAAVRQEALALVSPAALALLAGTLVVWAGSHAVGIGEGIDVLLLGVGYAAVGFSAFDAVRALGQASVRAVAATTPEALDAAAALFAHGVVELGVATLLLWLARTRGTGGTVAAETEAEAIARWEAYIDGLDLSFDGTRGALWSKLGDKGERAAALARGEGRVTLETVLGKTDFLDRYRLERGGADWSRLDEAIWGRVSTRFAGQLRGTVTVYVDKAKFVPRGAATAADPNAGTPILGEELLEILDRPGVTGVVIKDVANPSLSQVWTPADIARARGAAPPSGRWN